MKKLLILILLGFGCVPNKVVWECVQTCKSINAKDDIILAAGKYKCICSRYYIISDDGTNVDEVDK